MTTTPTLTPAQTFSIQVINVISYIAAALSGNINIAPPEGARSPVINFAVVYLNCYNTLFANTNGTPTQAATILSTQAASVFSFLSQLYTTLTTLGITSITVGQNTVTLSAIPVYTANSDGTVTLAAS